MSTDLRTYRAMVLEAMRRAQVNHKPEVFENSGPDHARIVLEVMLSNGLRSVDVIAGCMDAAVWPVEAINGFLTHNPSSRVRVLLDDSPGGDIPACSALHDVVDPRRVDVRWYPTKLARHLCVIDSSHVRVESNRLTREASITLGDPTSAGKRAAEIFEVLWNHSAHHEARLAS